VEIYKALRNQADVRNLVLERPIGNVRPDVSFQINGIQVAIEVQLSALSVQTIMTRTIEYGRENTYVLWLLQWSRALDLPRYSTNPWERWIHAAYYGRVYYWREGLNVTSYHFEPCFRTIPRKTWYSENGKKITAGGYSRRLKRVRTAVRGTTFNLATDFVARNRTWWEGNGIKVPDAKLFMEPYLELD
jgi:competence protein CoiA